MTKEGIRKNILTKRNNLPRSRVINKSRIIHRRLLKTMEFRNAKTILLYMPKDNEVDTRATIQLAIRKGKEVCLPRIDRRNNKLQCRIIRNLKEDILKGRYGIFEPRRGLPAPKKLDLIITPGVAFDLNRRRLGRGMAYYDKFLKGMKDIPKIGLAFETQVLLKLPEDKHDIPVDRVITEKRIF